MAKTRAANDLGCDESQVEVTSLGGTSFSATGCGSTRVYDCQLSDVGGLQAGYHSRNYVCFPESPAQSTALEGARETAAGPASPAAPPRRTDVAAPTGAAGFTLGSTVDATRAVCEEKFAWSASAADVFECSGTPKPIGPDARSLLKFCGDSLCKVIFLVHPNSEQSSDWLHPFVAFKGVLTGKYGEPVEDKEVPSSCVGDLLPCVRQGIAHVKYTWTFPDGTYIVLALSNAPGQDPFIRMTYGRQDPAEAPAL